MFPGRANMFSAVIAGGDPLFGGWNEQVLLLYERHFPGVTG